tara:strand:- start:280 stop:849 length:570 start_codon:yes stop_codon:yes gene_type:complete
MKYHSALRDELENQKEITHYTIKDSLAFYHDVIHNFGLPKEYNKCDILYAEPSWSGGITKFDKRANTSTTYNEYVASLNNIIKTTTIPIVLIVGIKDSKKLRTPFERHITKIHGAKAFANIYNWSYKGPLDDTYTIIENLSNQFDCVGDFCCGYGNTGEIFFKKNKNFIMSDYNKKCIGYIKENIGEDI